MFHSGILGLMQLLAFVIDAETAPLARRIYDLSIQMDENNQQVLVASTIVFQHN